MATKLTSLLSKIFYSSLASIAATNTADLMAETRIIHIPDDNKIESLAKRKIDLTPKLLLKRSNQNEFNFVSHRSHRSHSSHRSHYSSNAGGGGSSRTYSPPSSNNKPPSRQYTKPNSLYIPPSNLYSSPSNDNVLRSNNGLIVTKKAFQLGVRTLKRGMSGTDVTQLVNILLNKDYLSLDGGGLASGVYTYDSNVEQAVKLFQIDMGLTSDGICGPTTIYYLKNK